MSQQNKQMNTSTSSEFPVKRKRGRPRKDENLSKKDNSPLPITPHPPPPSDNTKKIEQVKVNSTTTNNNIDSNMVGKVVTGVIEGTFDAGYFLSVRAGNSNTLMRGVVFQPGHFTPISAANDIAPQVKMYTRTEFPIPSNFNPQNPIISTSIPQASEVQLGLSPYAINNQPATVTPKKDPCPSLGEKDPPQQGPPYGFTNQPAPLLKNLGMVEKDEVAHGFETTKDVILESASESMVDILLGNETIDQVPQGQNRGLEPNELVHNELENPNLEFHQTPLVSTNKLEAVSPQPQLVKSGFKPSEMNQTPLVSTEPLETEPAEPVDLEHNPSELVQNELKSENLELHQPPPTAIEPQPLPQDPVSEPMDIVMEDLIPSKNDEDSQAAKTETNAATAADMEGDQPLKPELGAEECVFTERLEPQNSSFASQAADMDFNIGEVIPPSQSNCYPSYVSENENR